MKPIVYIAAPYRAKTLWEVEQNIRVAEAAAVELAKREIYFLCPHTMTRFMDGLASDEYWLDMTMSLMLRCDWVLVAAPFENSEGTNAEIKAALRANMPIYTGIDELFRDYAEAINEHAK